MVEVGIGILTVSDTCSRGEAVDTSGNNLQAMIPTLFPKWNVDIKRSCVSDDLFAIIHALRCWSGGESARDVILTTGGTGLSPRDVTPEATYQVVDREAPGLVHLLMSKSLQQTPLAALSRLRAGVTGKTLIVNFPGSKKASAECLTFLKDILPHALDLLADRKAPVVRAHDVLQGGGSRSCSHSKVDTDIIASRDRKSPFPMIPVKEAQKMVLTECQKISLGPESVHYTDALGRVLAEDVYAKDPLPPFPASIKDGYAVISADGVGVRQMVGGATAGCGPESFHLSPGTCVRINTGAPVPRGADAVVMVENTRLAAASSDGRQEEAVEILVAPTPGLDIRPIGSDIAAGSLVLRKGSLCAAAEIGLLAAVGAIRVEVCRRPKVALLSTGDEVVDPNMKTLPPGAIRDSNKAMLAAFLRQEGIAEEVLDCGVARDEPGALLTKLRAALDEADVITSTGGVSMGDRDLLRRVLLEDLGADLHFARIDMKPGKPTTFATLSWPSKRGSKEQRKLVLGLPGNPVSAAVTTQLFLLPACRHLAGWESPFPATMRASLAADLKSLDSRPEFRRAKLSWTHGEAVGKEEGDAGNQISSRLLSCAGANALLMLPKRDDQKQSMKAGEEVDAMIIGKLMK